MTDDKKLLASLYERYAHGDHALTMKGLVLRRLYARSKGERGIPAMSTGMQSSWAVSKGLAARAPHNGPADTHYQLIITEKGKQIYEQLEVLLGLLNAKIDHG